MGDGSLIICNEKFEWVKIGCVGKYMGKTWIWCVRIAYGKEFRVLGTRKDNIGL